MVRAPTGYYGENAPTAQHKHLFLHSPQFSYSGIFCDQWQIIIMMATLKNTFAIEMLHYMFSVVAFRNPT